MRSRRGLTIVEVLVALVLVTIGLLGMAGSSALMLRRATDSARERRAVERASSRLALLAAAGCTRPSSGASGWPTDRMHERWSVLAPAAGVVRLEARVAWMGARRMDSLVLRSAVLC